MIGDFYDTAINIIKKVKTEYDALLSLEESLLEFNLTYGNVLDKIIESLTLFDKANKYNLLDHHYLSFAIVDILNLKFQKIYKNIKSVNNVLKDSIIPTKCLKNLFYGRTKPSNLNKLLENSYNEIFILLKYLDELENKIFGSAVRIKHSVFRNSWLLAGKNQLNNSSLSSNIFRNNLIVFYKRELKIFHKIDLDRRKKTKQIMKLIMSNVHNITTYVDSALTEYADDDITIVELNHINKKISDCKTIQDISNVINEKLDKEIINISEIINKDHPNLIMTKKEEEEEKNNQMNILDEFEYLKKRKCLDLFDCFCCEREINFESENDLSNNNNLSSNQNEKDSLVKKDDRILMLEDRLSKVQSCLKTDSETEEENEIDVDDKKKETKTNMSFTIRTLLDEAITFDGFENKDSMENRPIVDKNYGNDFPCKLLHIYKFENTTDCKIDVLSFEFNIQDQGWGDSGHLNVRYKINDSGTNVGFFVNRFKNKTNLYTLDINLSDLEKGSNLIYFYMFCPPWDGWFGKVNLINCKEYFEK